MMHWPSSSKWEQGGKAGAGSTRQSREGKTAGERLEGEGRINSHEPGKPRQHKPLQRQAQHALGRSHFRSSAGAREGAAEDTILAATVLELMQEEDLGWYGALRLVAHHINVPRHALDDYMSFVHSSALREEEAQAQRELGAATEWGRAASLGQVLHAPTAAAFGGTSGLDGAAAHAGRKGLAAMSIGLRRTLSRISAPTQPRPGSTVGIQRPARPGLAGQFARGQRSVFGLPMLAPYSHLGIAWALIMLLIDVTYTAYGVPVSVAFCSTWYGRWQPCMKMDLAFGIIYLANLLICLHTGVVLVNGALKKGCAHGGRVLRYYVMYGRGWIDVLSVVPLVYLFVVLGLQLHPRKGTHHINTLSLIRLVRMLRVVSISRVVYADSLLGKESMLGKASKISGAYGIILAYQVSVVINLFACLFVLVAYLQGMQGSWMSSVDWTDVPNASKVYQWYCAVYFVIVAATTTGFGDFSPRRPSEQVLVNICLISGMLMFGVLVASISNALARATRDASILLAMRQKLSSANRWLNDHDSDLHPSTRRAISSYFAQLFVTRQEAQPYREAELFADLPPHLREEAAEQLTMTLVVRLHGLRDVQVDAQQMLAAHLQPVAAPIGSELCRQGDEGDRLWVLAGGCVVASRHKEGQGQLVHAPALLGESIILAMDVLACRQRPWTLRAASACALWELRVPDLARVLQVYPEVRRALLECLRAGVLKHLLGLQEVYDLRDEVGEEQWQEGGVGAPPAAAAGAAAANGGGGDGVSEVEMGALHFCPPPSLGPPLTATVIPARTGPTSAPLPPGISGSSSTEWCEMVALVVASSRTTEVLDESPALPQQLALTSIENGSLQALLGELIDQAMVRYGDRIIVTGSGWEGGAWRGGGRSSCAPSPAGLHPNTPPPSPVPPSAPTALHAAGAADATSPPQQLPPPADRSVHGRGGSSFKSNGSGSGISSGAEGQAQRQAQGQVQGPSGASPPPRLDRAMGSMTRGPLSRPSRLATISRGPTTALPTGIGQGVSGGHPAAWLPPPLSPAQTLPLGAGSEAGAWPAWSAQEAGTASLAETPSVIGSSPRPYHPPLSPPPRLHAGSALQAMYNLPSVFGSSAGSGSFHSVFANRTNGGAAAACGEGSGGGAGAGAGAVVDRRGSAPAPPPTGASPPAHTSNSFPREARGNRSIDGASWSMQPLQPPLSLLQQQHQQQRQQHQQQQQQQQRQQGGGLLAALRGGRRQWGAGAGSSYAGAAQQQRGQGQGYGQGQAFGIAGAGGGSLDLDLTSEGSAYLP